MHYITEAIITLSEYASLKHAAWAKCVVAHTTFSQSYTFTQSVAYPFDPDRVLSGSRRTKLVCVWHSI